MAQTFNFELVSPERKLMSEPAWQVVVPGEEGQIGVRAGHSSLVASLQPGVVEVWQSEGEKSQRIFIAGGFADITAGNCTVLAEEAANVDDLNQAAIEQDIRNFFEDLTRAQTETDKARAEASLKLAKARLSAVTGRLVL